MMKAALPLLLVVAAAPVQASPSTDRAEVLAAVQELFDALGARDAQRLMTRVVPEGTITAHGPSGIRPQRWQDWANGLANGTERLEERMHNPQVRIDGNMASVWAEYSFYVNGRFSHCGVDLFDMAKVAGRWRALNLSFTMRPQGCPRR
jgi:hypothetical protein